MADDNQGMDEAPNGEGQGDVPPVPTQDNPASLEFPHSEKRICAIRMNPGRVERTTLDLRLPTKTTPQTTCSPTGWKGEKRSDKADGSVEVRAPLEDVKVPQPSLTPSSTQSVLVALGEKSRKRTLPPVVRGVPPPSEINRPIAPYAANKLRLQQYVDLWYFTEEGLNRAGGYQAYEGESSVTLAQASSAIVVTAPTPPSKDAKRDEELTWDQVSKARTSFLSYAKGYGWKAEHLEMFSIFFICLDAHPIRNEPKGNETVIQYQAHYRRQWHLTCEQQNAAAFDLATISDDALRTIRAKIIEQHTWATLQSFQRIIDHEFATGRYIGPFSRLSLESLIGPFQSSPLSLIPKPHKPHVFRLIQNFSFPRQPSNGISSINYHIDPANFPCTWGTFHTFALLCWRLPPGSQGAVRDVAEAYRIIPLHHSQWPGTVVRLEEDQFAVDTCAAFGVGSHAGLYSSLADACTDIMRARGLGPMAKWVDNTVFLCIRREHLVAYNQQRLVWREQIVRHGGMRHSGGRLWFGGDELPDGNVDEFIEDMRFPLRNLADVSPRGESDTLYSYCLSDIDDISSSLGVPWQLEKDHPFSSECPFTGFLWNLDGMRSVSIPRAKADKYIAAIDVWLQKPTHDLKEVQQLHGKLWHASLVIQRGRAFLVNLEAMLGIFHDRLFVPRTPPRHTAADLKWWRATLSRPALSRQLPSPCAVWDPLAYSDASSGVGIAVVIHDRWRAWRLLPGWKSDGRDIGWAEAVGFEFLVHTVLAVSWARNSCAFKAHGDNRGVRIAAELEEQQSRALTRYVQSAVNPTDGPSRGIYPSTTLLLPPIPIPAELQPFIIDFDAPPMRGEARALSQGRSPTVELKGTHSNDELRRRRGHNEELDEINFHWRSTYCSSRWQRDANGDASQLSPEDIQRITDVSAYAWAESTLGTYGTGLLIFHVFCDLRSIPEGHRAPADELLILAFVASIAGSYAQSAINNYVAGVRAWHILHGLPWNVDKNRYDAALAGAAQLAPPASKRPSRTPLALQEITRMAASFTLADPVDAAVWACLCVGFFSLARLGELTVTTQKSFQMDLHPSRTSVRLEAHRDGSEVRVIHLPRTKSAVAGEDISFARQDGAADPWAALDNHFTVNQLAPSVHLFAYRKPSTNAIIPLTRRAFLARVKVAALGIGLPNVSGHSLRIGGTLEYLLKGLSFETVKAIGRWKSEAFTLYLRKHAQVLAPYLQDNQEVLGELSCRTIQLPPSLLNLHSSIMCSEMKRFCPSGLQYAVVRIDPVAMVEHFNDPIAIAEGHALDTKKYLVYLEVAIDMPFPTNKWFRYRVGLIGATLCAEDPSRGITSDMAIPIYPNTSHPSGRTPVDPETPFPFPNCYHWVKGIETVRIRGKAEMYDEAHAVKISAMQHVNIQKALSADLLRIHKFRMAQTRSLATALANAQTTEDVHVVGPDQPPRIHVSSPQATSSSQNSRLSDRTRDTRYRSNEPLATGNGLEIPRSNSPMRHPRRVDPDLEGIIRMDIFDLAHDDPAEYIPLVDLWFELSEHLTADTIPSPLDFQKERDAIARIIRDARGRAPHVPSPLRNDDGLSIMSDESSIEDSECAEPDGPSSSRELRGTGASPTVTLAPSSETPDLTYHGARSQLLVGSLHSQIQYIGQASAPKLRAATVGDRVRNAFHLQRMWSIRPPFLLYWP
ncbi:hypothetical protein ACG7TL_008616 [Trametes sanguinea]